MRTNDILVATTRPNLNAVARVPRDLDGEICSTGFCVLRAGPKLHPGYLFAFVQAPQFVQSLSSLVKGALYPAVTDRQVLEQSIPLPPSLSDQTLIAAKIEETLVLIQRARAATEARLKAVIGLETAYLREEFQPAKGWPKRPLGEIARVVGGSTPDSSVVSYWNGDIVWVTPTDLGRLEDREIYGSERQISRSGYEGCGVELVPPGSVVISSRAPIGHLGVAATQLCTNQGCKTFVPSEKIDSEFLYFALKLDVPILRELGSGATFREVSKSALERHAIHFPDLDQQKAISRRLKDKLAAAKRMVASASGEIKSLDAFPAALLRRAFAGEL